MKDKIFFDIGQIMDEIFEATKNFGESMKNGFRKGNPFHFEFDWDDRIDFYPAYSYPPTNVYMAKDKSIYFEFALAGFQGDAIDLQLQGDYMVLNASCPEKANADEVRYFKRRLKFKEIRNQKYYVPRDKYDRENVKAVFKNGLLKVYIPVKEGAEAKDGVKINIAEEEE